MQFCSKCDEPFNDYEKRKSHEAGCSATRVGVAREPKPPNQIWQCEIKVGGDTRENMVSLLASLVADIERGSNGPIVHGGCSSSGNVKITHDELMTPEQYKTELLKWHEQVTNGR